MDMSVRRASSSNAIGAGIVLAEIQQRSDATFRLFDYGRQRELHAENAVAVAETGAARHSPSLRKLSDSRALLIASPHFIFERIELLPNSDWVLKTPPESWILVIRGDADIDVTHAALGDVIFADAQHINISAGADGMTALLAYVGPNAYPELLEQQYQTVPTPTAAALSYRPTL